MLTQTFDPLFSAVEYGTVICDGVSLADIPMDLQESRVFQLTLRSNHLAQFPDAKLSGTGENFEDSETFIYQEGC